MAKTKTTIQLECMLCLYFNVTSVTDSQYQFIANTQRCKTQRKEMFYLTTHSTHLWLYDVTHGHMDNSDSKRLTASVVLYASSHNRITHTTAFVTLVREHWLEREIAQWVHHEGSIRRCKTQIQIYKSYVSYRGVSNMANVCSFMCRRQ